MPLVEVILTYRPESSGATEVRVAATSRRPALLALKGELLEEAREEVTLWSGIDSRVEAMRRADAERLRQVLDTLIPEPCPDPEKAHLRLVQGTEEAEDLDP